MPPHTIYHRQLLQLLTEIEAKLAQDFPESLRLIRNRVDEVMASDDRTKLVLTINLLTNYLHDLESRG
jgi:hypothetical protein